MHTLGYKTLHITKGGKKPCVVSSYFFFFFFTVVVCGRLVSQPSQHHLDDGLTDWDTALV